jgi:hypothetical protein
MVTAQDESAPGTSSPVNRDLKGLQETFAVQLLGVMEDTLVLVLDRKGKVILAGENSIRWISEGSKEGEIPYQSPRDLIGREVPEIPRVREIPDVEDAVSISRSGTRTKLQKVSVSEKVRIRGHVEPIMARGTTAAEGEQSETEQGSQTSFVKGQMIGAILVLRDEAQLVASIDVLELLEERGISDAAGLGVVLEEKTSPSSGDSDKINWTGDLQEVFEGFLKNLGIEGLEVSLWSPHEEEGAKLVQFANARKQEPLELVMTATMLFAMEESSQVNRAQFALRVMEDDSSLVSIREGDGERLSGVLLFSGKEAARVYEPLALRLAERCHQELLERALLESGL